MSELTELKERIDGAFMNGLETAIVRDDYEPIGDMMIRDLVATGEYVTRKVPPGSYDAVWKIFKTEYAPFR